VCWGSQTLKGVFTQKDLAAIQHDLFEFVKHRPVALPTDGDGICIGHHADLQVVPFLLAFEKIDGVCGRHFPTLHLGYMQQQFQFRHDILLLMKFETL
jgi:hypothetical protein